MGTYEEPYRRHAGNDSPDAGVHGAGTITVNAGNHPAPERCDGLECERYSKETVKRHYNGFSIVFLPSQQAVMEKGMAVERFIDRHG